MICKIKCIFVASNYLLTKQKDYEKIIGNRSCDSFIQCS